MSGPGKRQQIKDHLRNQFGLSTEQIEELLPSFLKTLHGYLDELEAAAAADDLEQLGKRAHTAKGALLNLGLGKSAERARSIELLARTGKKSTDYPARAAELREGLADYFD